MRLHVSAVCGLWLGLGGAVMAQDLPKASAPIVVELYTSQGCSSCPPADAFMAELSQQPDILALSLHVDYWDYIGWKDTFAQPQFTLRQKAYAKAANSRMIYTPQMIINGVEQVEGNDPDEVKAAIARQMPAQSGITLQLSREGDEIHVLAESTAPLDRNVDVQMFRYMPSATVGIGRGENAGLEVVYSNIVTEWGVLGAWSGAPRFETRRKAPAGEPVVVIVQDVGPGAILAAAKID